MFQVIKIIHSLDINKEKFSHEMYKCSAYNVSFDILTSDQLFVTSMRKEFLN